MPSNLPPAEDNAARTELNELAAVIEALEGDVHALAQAREDGHGVLFPDAAKHDARTRRHLVRAIFAAVEGVTYRLKLAALEKLDASNSTISDADRAMLREVAYELDDAGRARSRTATIRVQPNVRYAFTSFSRAYDSGFALDLSDGGWDALVRSIKVRNRIVHPKCRADADISDDEIRAALRAYVWFSRQVSFSLIAAVLALKARVDRLQDVADATRLQADELQDQSRSAPDQADALRPE